MEGGGNMFYHDQADSFVFHTPGSGGSDDGYRVYPKGAAYMPVMSRHASKRAGQRRISLEAIKAALDFGTVTYRTGAIFSTLLKKDIKRAKRPGLRKHLGTTVLSSSSQEDVIITVYRNSNAISRIKRLPKWGRKYR